MGRVQVFHKRMPPEAVDLVSRLLQYSPNLRCNAVSGEGVAVCLGRGVWRRVVWSGGSDGGGGGFVRQWGGMGVVRWLQGRV